MYNYKIAPCKLFFYTDIENKFIFAAAFGALAQLARAFDWQSRGHRFDSDMLHSENQAVNNGFFYLKKLMCTQFTDY